jgi:hypothetical protein
MVTIGDRVIIGIRSTILAHFQELRGVRIVLEEIDRTLRRAAAAQWLAGEGDRSFFEKHL